MFALHFGWVLPSFDFHCTRRPGDFSRKIDCLVLFAQMFNVDTTDVAARLKHALLPFASTSMFEVLGDNPDMYGPFWIAATLVFVIGAASNWNSWMSTPHEKVLLLFILLIMLSRECACARRPGAAASAAPCLQGRQASKPERPACDCARPSRTCFGHKTVKADHK